MTLNGWLQLSAFFLAVLVVTRPLGIYMTSVFSGEKTFMSRVIGPDPRLALRAAADLCRRRAAAGVTRRRTEPQALHDGSDGRATEGRNPERRWHDDDPHNHRADYRTGACGIAGDHQRTRHQRRRLLQRQLGAPVREPHAAFELL